MQFNRTRHRAMMAMAAAGVLTALAQSVPAYADTEETESVSAASLAALNAGVMDVGIQSAAGNRVVQYANAAWDNKNTNKYEKPMGSNCNFYSSYFGHGCQAWCADFVKFVWKQAGIYSWQSLNSEAGTAARWGKVFNSWHPGTTAGIYPGAAVTYNRSGDPLVDSDHVGIFVGWVNGAPKVISGNFNNQVYKHNLHYGTPIAGWTGV